MQSDVTMPEEVNLKYRWKRRPGDPETLFHGDDGDRRMGRIEKSIVGTHWLWFMNFLHNVQDPRVAVTLNGAAPGAREAAAACETCYDAFLAGTWPGVRFQRMESQRQWEPELLQRVAPVQRTTRPTQATVLKLVK